MHTCLDVQHLPHSLIHSLDHSITRGMTDSLSELFRHQRDPSALDASIDPSDLGAALDIRSGFATLLPNANYVCAAAHFAISRKWKSSL